MVSTNVRQKSIGKMRKMRLLAVLLVPAVILIMVAAASHVRAQEISEAEVFFEFNSTDLDLGFDIFLDADPWVEATLTAPDGITQFFLVNTGGGLEDKGNTEIFTESAEPPFADEFCLDSENCTPAEIAAAIADFQDNFPEGDWEIEVLFVDNPAAESATVTLSYDLPAAPEILRPREGGKLKKVKNIRWRDTSSGDDPEIVEYEVVAEMVVMVDDEEQEYVNTATLPGTAKEFTISKEFRRIAKRAKKRGELVEFKAEVIARGDNLNKTITEVVVYEMEEDDEDDEDEE